MTFHFRSCTKVLAGVAVVSLIAACSSDLTGSNRRPVQLSVTTNATAGPAANLMAGDMIVGAGNDRLVLETVQLVFGRIELDRSGTAECIEDEVGDDDFDDFDDDYGDDYGDRRRRGDDDDSRKDDDDNDDEDCEEVLRGPHLVDDLVDGKLLHPLIEFSLAGTFSELEAKLEPAKPSETAFNDAHEELVGKSVRVVGTFTKADGTVVPFEFTSRMRTKLELEFDPPIDDATTNVTMSINVRSWFKNSFGRVLDPTDPNNRRRIENNIRRSFRAFEDNDRHGDDDHDRGHG